MIEAHIVYENGTEETDTFESWDSLGNYLIHQWNITVSVTARPVKEPTKNGKQYDLHA